MYLTELYWEPTKMLCWSLGSLQIDLLYSTVVLDDRWFPSIKEAVLVSDNPFTFILVPVILRDNCVPLTTYNSVILIS